MVRNWKYYGQRADMGELYITKHQFMTGNLVGILMAPDEIQDMRGHLGNASTFKFPVRYKVVESLYSNERARIGEEIRDRIAELELEGCRCVIASGGMFALYDSIVRNATDLPSASTPFVELEFAALSLSPNKKILVYSRFDESQNRQFLSALNMPGSVTKRCLFTQDERSVSDEYCRQHQIGAVIWDSPEGIHSRDMSDTPVYSMAKLAVFLKNVAAQQPYEGNI